MRASPILAQQAGRSCCLRHLLQEAKARACGHVQYLFRNNLEPAHVIHFLGHAHKTMLRCIWYVTKWQARVEEGQKCLSLLVPRFDRVGVIDLAGLYSHFQVPTLGRLSF